MADTGNNDSTAPLSSDERAELERLRREVTELRSSAPAPLPEAKATAASGHPGLRWTAAALLLVLVAVLGIGAVAARFARSEVLDTDRYVQTVTPLASEPALQSALANEITDQIMSRVDVEQMTADALTGLTEVAPRVPSAVVGLAPVIAGQAETFVRNAATKLVESSQFETMWIEANRQAHEELVSVATGENSGSVSIDDRGQVSVNLAAIIDTVKADLVNRGFSFVDRIPDVDASFVVFQSADLVKAQRLVNWLNTASAVLPWLTLLAAALAVWAAPPGGRRRAVSLVGATLAIAMGILAVGISIGRSVYLSEVPSDVLSPDAAAILFDTLVQPLRTTLRAVFVLAVLIGLIGYLSGASASATAIRRTYTKAMDRLRSPSADRAPRPVETYAATFRLPLRIAIVVIAVATLVFWKYPSGTVVIVTILIALAALLAVEVLARPALATREAPTPAEPTATEPRTPVEPTTPADSTPAGSTTNHPES
ncbi:conserved membrane hypothetical protein [Rhodococcus sp. RD6.2]|uniref:hypothetical protein n=1 Tax=Rhodococcus sp. RD6.2 TaxID=260936 RepID=UPI00063B5F36|nr:hypothetical protein [Rhodococcus sp. RD6.2]CRK52611.1 conserved membrane hypothetical protein [Rhodococcus sp. RD6.2]